MSNSSSLSLLDRFNVAKQAGFDQSQAIIMAAISTFECGGCEMSSVNQSGDVGLFQINRQHWGSSSFTTSIYGDLSNPVNSARAALDIFKRQGFNAWCVYPGGCGGAAVVAAAGGRQPTTAEFGAVVARVVAAVEGGGGSTTPSGPDTSGQGTTGTPGPSGTGGQSQPGSTGLNSLGDIPGPFGVGSISVTGMIVVAFAILLLILGALAWKGSTMVKVVAPASGAAKALRIAEA